MVTSGGRRPLRGIVAALGTTTALGVCCLAPDIALAQCDINPTQAYATTTCTGTDPNTLVANTTGSSVSIQAGASVAAILATAVPVIGSSYQPGNAISITDNGQIIGGLTIDSGPVPANTYYVPTESVTLTVGANASIGGSTAINLIAETNGTQTGAATLSLTNQGSIQSNSGPAITGNGNANAVVTSLTNATGASIGAIQAVIENLSNSGTITGGSGSAIDTTVTNGNYFGQLTWQNSGTITASGAAPTINAVSGLGAISLTNSGTITNTGTGSAIGGSGNLTVTNSGTISGSTFAIQTSGALTLNSTGTINGSVEADNVNGYGGSTINLGGGGTINGSLILGAWSNGYTAIANVLVVDYASGATPLAAISGTVSIGGTNNALILNLPASTTLSAPVSVPDEFSTLVLQLASSSTVTLGSGFTTPLGLTLSIASPYYGSAATLVNTTTLATTGAALIELNPYSQVAIVNSGTITANLAAAPSGTYAVTAQVGYGVMALSNSGTITGTGGNGAYTYGSATNTGTITADGIALAVFDGTLTNSGTITGGNTGLYLLGGSGTNTGTITGGQIGASLSSTTLTNSGTITGTAGPGAAISAYSTLINQQGGVINGGIAGLLDNSVTNAGTINGNVNLSTIQAGPTNNTFVAAAGGVLNGNLNLGNGGDTLVVTLGRAGSGLYPGITGTVTGTGTETLLSLVTADATATLAQPNAVFSVFGYDLANKATLTLTSATPVTGSYAFAGTGTVNLTADISGTGASSLLNLTRASMQTDAAGNTVPTALAFTSNGTLSVTASGTGAAPVSAVLVGAADTFTNAGTINYADAVQQPQYAYYFATGAAITNAGSVTNTGTIAVGGGVAVAAAPFTDSPISVVNSGSIVQIAGATDAIGLYQIGNVTNTGTIATGGTAVDFDSGFVNTLTNSGTITSTDSVAVGSDGLNYFVAAAQVTNAAGGTISGGTGQAAIALGSGSSVVNAGTINGDVQLGASGSPYGIGSTYVANGGTLNGNLTFGGNNNTMVVIGDSTGVTGTISTGGGTGNLYAQGFTASATIDPTTATIPAGFQTYGFGAIGTGTTLTISGPAGGLNAPLNLFGNGTVINTATINSNYGQNIVTLDAALTALLNESGGLTFVNAGNLGDGVQGTALSFTNNGTIGTAGFQAQTTLTAASAPTFTFDNTGQIWGSVMISQASPPPAVQIPNQVTIDNSGTIAYVLDVDLAAANLTLTNSGSVNAVYVDLNATPGVTGGGLVSATNTASGAIAYGISIYAGANQIAFNNAGTVTQGVNLWQETGSPTDQASATFTNAGTIAGYVNMSLASSAVTVANSGTITSAQIYGADYGGLTVDNTTAGNGSVALTNTGTIANATPSQSAATIIVNAGSTSAPAAAAVSVTNSGSITASGGGQYEPFFIDQFVASALAVSATAPGGTATVAITNQAGGTITANGANTAGYGEYGPGEVPPALINSGSVALIASASTVTVSNAGTITGGGDTPLTGNGVYVQINGLSLPSTMTTLAGAIDLIATSASLTNTGTINGNTLVYAPAATLANYGTINGNVTLGTGAGTGTASVVEGINATINGTVTGAAATDTLTIDITGGGLLGQATLAPFVGFAAPHLTGDGTVSFSGAMSTLLLDNAALTLAAGQVLQGTGPIVLVGGIGTNSFTNYGTVNGAIVDIATTNGAGGVINIATTATSDAPFINEAGAALNLTAGMFTIDALLTNGGTITVASGATFDAIGGIANTQGSLIQVAAGAVVNDTLVNAGSVVNNGAYNADIVNQAGGTFTTTGTVTAPDAIANAGTFTVNGSTVSTPLFTNQTGGVLAGTVTFNTPGGTDLVNQGTISGTVAFGAGSNTLVIETGSQITGAVTGGSGSNLLAIVSSATDTAPDQYTLANITGFQQSELLSGSVALSGSYTTGSFAVLGGHLIGNAGSIINAGTITVASGAAFGSAGTVNANVTVNGTLAPIGTMTVNGNVALGAGSTTVLSGTAIQSPQLTVEGKVVIASGASLTLTSALPVRQGALVQLITASDGISGTFATTGLASAYDLINTGDVLEAYRPFVAGAGFGGNATAAVTMINSLVVAQQANAALLTDLAVLDNAQGTADAGKFARLTPEPYATATQIGLDNALQISEALRDFDHAAAFGPGSGARHLFTFAQGLGNWTHASGSAASGAATATNSAGGILGGLGWRNADAMVGVFAGGLHDQQSIGALGASTTARSTLFGANAAVRRGAFDVAATLTFDNGTADTTRVLPDGTTTWSGYGLRARVADVALGYTIGFGPGWTMRPQIGLTDITIHRDAATELGSTAFGLTIAGERRKLDFADASWRIAAPATGHFTPWASVGLRTRLNSDTTQAAALLPGADTAFDASGVVRAGTDVTYKAGFAYALSAAVTFYATYDGEHGSGGSVNALNGGVRLAF